MNLDELFALLAGYAKRHDAAMTIHSRKDGSACVHPLSDTEVEYRGDTLTEAMTHAAVSLDLINIQVFTLPPAPHQDDPTMS